MNNPTETSHPALPFVDAVDVYQTVTIKLTLTFQQMEWLSTLLTDACLTVPCTPEERAFRRDLAEKYDQEIVAVQEWVQDNLSAEEQDRQNSGYDADDYVPPIF